MGVHNGTSINHEFEDRMSRSGYSDDYDSNYANLYRGIVDRAFKGKRGYAFLVELAKAMDETPKENQRLIAHDLVRKDGEVCAIGVVCKARGLDVSKVDIEDAESVGKAVGISRSMAAEIEYMNDEFGRTNETPEERWIRMRKWIQECIDQKRSA